MDTHLIHESHKAQALVNGYEMKEEVWHLRFAHLSGMKRTIEHGAARQPTWRWY